jgi:hypothetical protein
VGRGLSKAHIHPEVLVGHADARTTVHGRLLIVARYRASWPKAHIPAAMGISHKCVSTWLGRYAAEGEAGLADRSSRPHNSPRRTAPRRGSHPAAGHPAPPRAGADQIGAELGVPTRTLSRVLVRRGRPPVSRLAPSRWPLYT